MTEETTATLPEIKKCGREDCNPKVMEGLFNCRYVGCSACRSSARTMPDAVQAIQEWNRWMDQGAFNPRRRRKAAN